MARKNKKVGVDAETKSGSGEEKGEAAFWTALKRADVEALQAILFDPLPMHAGTNDSSDATNSAARLSVKPTARALVNSLNAKKERPLSFAVANDVGEDILCLLLRAGAEVNGRDQTKAQSTALHTAYWGEDEIAAQLLLRCGADVRLRDSEGRTALHVLASSNAAAIVTDLLERIAHPIHTEHDHDHRHVESHSSEYLSAAGLRGKVPLLLDPMAVLLLRDKSGATALDLALAEVGYGGVGVAEAFLDFVEQQKRHHHKDDNEGASDDKEDSVTAQIDELMNGPAEDISEEQSSQQQQQPALHCLLSADQGDVSCIARVLPRLLALGAAPLRLNSERRTALDMAVLHTSPTSELSKTIIIQLLQAMQPVPRAATLQSDAALRQRLFTRHDEDGNAFVHSAILARHTSAVRAVWDFVTARSSATDSHITIDNTDEDMKTLARQCLGEPRTASGQTTAELLANVNDEAMAELLINIGAVDADVVQAARAKAAERARQLAEAAAVAAKEVEEEKEATGDYSGSGPTSAAQTSAELPTRPLPSAGSYVTGASRVQQARKARAVTLAHRRQQQQQEREQQQQGQEDDEEEEEKKNKKQQPRRKQQQLQQRTQQRKQAKQEERESEADDESTTRHTRHDTQRETEADAPSAKAEHSTRAGQASAPLLVLVFLVVVAGLVLIISSQKK